MKGLSIPVRAVRGRAVLEEGEEQMKKIIALAISEGESSNPFNSDAGISVPIWNADSPVMRTLLRRGIEAHFTRWQAENRAKLLGLDFGSLTEGELNVQLRYVDLETDRETEITKVV